VSFVVKFPVHRMCCILLGACTPNGEPITCAAVSNGVWRLKGLGCLHSFVGNSRAAVVRALPRVLTSVRSTRRAAAFASLRRAQSCVSDCHTT